MTTIDLALLPPFLAVAELGSFSAAAKRLGLEKSSVSRAVARFERVVGATLFHRTTRRVVLSGAGQAVYGRLREPFASLEGAVKALAGLAEAPAGRVVVTAPIDFGAAFVADVVARFVGLYPDVEVDLRLANEVLDLVAGGFDAAIRISTKRLRDSTMKARIVGQVRLGLFASPAYLERWGVPRTPAETEGHAFIVFPSTKRLRLTGPGGALDLATAGRVSCNDMFFVHHAVLSGIGLGVLPHFLADREVARERMVNLFPSWTAVSGNIWFLTPASRMPSRAVVVFRELLSETLALKGMTPA
jgi:DNA-binding transcriptional LysR family regulator